MGLGMLRCILSRIHLLHVRIGHAEGHDGFIAQHILLADADHGQIVFDFYDKLKSISKGYASCDYHRTGYQPSKLVKLDILLNGEPVDALSSLTYTDHAYDFGRKCAKSSRS